MRKGEALGLEISACTGSWWGWGFGEEGEIVDFSLRHDAVAWTHS